MTPDGSLEKQIERIERDVQILRQEFVRKEIWDLSIAGIKEDVRSINDRLQRIFWLMMTTIAGVGGTLVVFFLTRSV